MEIRERGRKKGGRGTHDQGEKNEEKGEMKEIMYYY